MKILTELSTQSCYVKPIEANNPDTQWLVIWHTPIQAFVDDWQRYGLSIAWFNFKATLA